MNGTDWRKLDLAVENVSIATGLDRPEVKVVDLGGVNALSLSRGNKETLVLVKLIKMMGGGLVMLLLMLYIAFYCALAVLWIPLWLAFYMLVLPRNRDVLADAQAVMITRDPEAVASLLRKAGIKRSGRPRRGSFFISHMFFNQPLKPQGRIKKMVYGLFDRHPKMEERVALIEAMN